MPTSSSNKRLVPQFPQPKILLTSRHEASQKPAPSLQLLTSLFRKRKAIGAHVDEPSAKCIRGPAILHSRPADDFVSRQTIVYLPPELISIIAELLCDKDLYSLTRVCHYLASITCPIFLARQTLRQRPQSLSLRGQAFEFLPMWHRSPAFSPLPLLFCWFSVYSESAAAQMKCLQKTLPMLSSSVAVGGTLFDSVYLSHVAPIDVDRVLGLLHTVVFRTKCRSVSLRATGPRDPFPKLYPSSAASVLRTVHELSLSYDRLSVPQWTSFLSGLAAPSLQSLEIVGGTSMGAVYKFLVRHPGIRQLSFTKCTMKPFSPSSRQLHMPDLDILKGSLRQVLDVLESLSVLPHLSELLIEPGAYIKMPHDIFTEEIVRCLAMCDNVIRLVVKIPQSMFENGTPIVHWSPRITLANCHLTELVVEFEDVSDEVIQVCRQRWMKHLPDLREVGQKKTELVVNGQTSQTIRYVMRR